MRAHVELTPSEKEALRRLSGHERHVVIDQMIERVREELEWELIIDRARVLVAHASAAVETETPRPAAAGQGAGARFCWPSTPMRTR
jgi:hypothetical protein